MNITYDKSVFVDLVNSMQLACAVLYFYLWSVAVSYFSTLSHKQHNF